MLWEFTYKGEKYINWGHPRCIPMSEITNQKIVYDYRLYDGSNIQSNQKILFTMEGDNTLGLGDSIWLINFLRDIYSVKARRKGKFVFCSSEWVIDFYKQFLPPSFIYKPLYLLKNQLKEFDYIIPVSYARIDKDNADKSWIDGKSFLERLYNCAGIEYNGLLDWGDFTDEKILCPPDSFWDNLNLDKNQEYVYFQWNASGYSKNIHPSQNLKIIEYLINKLNCKIYIIGKGPNIPNILIPNVINLFNKTIGRSEDLLSLVFNSKLVVTPDSCGLHIAEAFRIPCVCITSILPPSYIANKYKIPSFMLGNGYCKHMPCGNILNLPITTKCPMGTKNYCNVLSSIDLELFGRCIDKTFENRNRYRSTNAIKFSEVNKQPI